MKFLKKLRENRSKRKTKVFTICDIEWLEGYAKHQGQIKVPITWEKEKVLDVINRKGMCHSILCMRTISQYELERETEKDPKGTYAGYHILPYVEPFCTTFKRINHQIVKTYE